MSDLKEEILQEQQFTEEEIEAVELWIESALEVNPKDSVLNSILKKLEAMKGKQK